MKFEDFTSGKFVQQYEYKSFTPTLVNREWTWEDPRINSLLEETTRSLAELDAFSKMVPDVDRYIYMHVVKEANTSSARKWTMPCATECTLPKKNVTTGRKCTTTSMQ